MNAQNSVIKLTDVHRLSSVSRALKPIPQHVDEEIDDILLFGLADDFEDETPKQLPVKHNTAPNIVPEHVPSTLLRKVAREISENDCDPRTVFSACHGLTRGTRRFEEAYTAARIRSFAKSQRIPTNLYQSNEDQANNPMPAYTQATTGRQLPHPSDPMAVVRLGHLMDHFGIWVVGLLGVQFFSAWKTAGLASEFLEGGLIFYFGSVLMVMLALDTWVWFTRRGNFSNVFHVPGVFLFSTAFVPVLLLHMREVLQ